MPNPELPLEDGKQVRRRPMLHSEPLTRHFGADEFRFWGNSCRTHSIKKGTYATDRECIEAGDICASPALFEG